MIDAYVKTTEELFLQTYPPNRSRELSSTDDRVLAKDVCVRIKPISVSVTVALTKFLLCDIFWNIGSYFVDHDLCLSYFESGLRLSWSCSSLALSLVDG